MNGYIVSIHAPARGATRRTLNTILKEMFQSTPLREGRLFRGDEVLVLELFQSTPLREGRPYITPHTYAMIVFQSTPLREGRRSPRGL